MNIMPKTALAAAVGLAVSIIATSSFAAELEEVVVTAQKRSQNLQETPISISVFDKEALQQQSIEDISDVSEYAPNVQIAESPGGSTGATIAMRGTVTGNPAVTWEPSVAIYLDGVFISKNVGGIFDVAELERIEVLRGPQGTLYGKNTIGGAINLVTSKPGDEFAAEISAGGGNYGSSNVGFSIDTGLVGEMASFNLAYKKRERDGFYDNTFPAAAASKFKELDTEAGRLSAQFDVNDELEINYSYDWADKDNTPSFGQFDSLQDPNSHKRRESGASDGSDYDTSESSGHGLNISYQLSNNVTLKSITSVRDMEFQDRNDYDGFPFLGFHAQRDVEHEQRSQEFQIIGSTDNFDYVAGLFYFKEDSKAQNPFIFAFGTIRNFYGVEATSIAAYGQLDWRATDKLTVTAGLRYSKEDKDFFIHHPDDFNFDGQADIPRTDSSDSWNNVTPALVLTYNWSENVSSYAKISKGWKAGGFNGEAASAAISQVPYDEETVDAIEFGIKSRLLDNRLQLNASIFNNDVQDLQISEFLGAYSRVSNAGSATIKGFEVDMLAALTDNLTFNVNYGYMDAEYDKYILGGVDIKDVAVFSYTPENTYSMGLEYHLSTGVGELSARIDLSHVDDHDVYSTPATASFTTIKSYDLLNARVTLMDVAVGGDASMKFSLWGKNLTDEEYRINGVPVANQLGQFVGGVNYYGNPRTYGLDVSLSF